MPAGRGRGRALDGRSDRFTVNLNEFFNRRVGQVYYTGGPTPGGIGRAARRASTSARRRPHRRRPRSPRPTYLLTDGSVEPNAVPVARDRALGMTVWKVDGPLVLAKTMKTGLYPGDTWSGPRVTWTREHCRGGSLTVSLSGDAQLFPDGNTVTASAGAACPRAPEHGWRRSASPSSPRRGTLHGRVRRRADRGPEPR